MLYFAQYNMTSSDVLVEGAAREFMMSTYCTLHYGLRLLCDVMHLYT
jgi:hypothetical protein